MYTIRRIKKKTIKLLMKNISLLFTNENCVGKFSSIIFNKNNDKVKKKLKNYIGNSIDISNVSNNHQN
jgi:hypothetical protein